LTTKSAKNPTIPWAQPQLWGNEEKYVVEALRSTWISGGPFVERFEADLAQYLGCKHAFAVANGTAALHLAFLALDLKAGDEVVIPAFGFMAAANISRQLGFRPVFCDVDAETWCVRADHLKAAMTSKTKAFVVIHTYGNVSDMDAIMTLSDASGIPVVEDAAEALGSRFGGTMAGASGTINTFSFHATKTITTGEGGLVTTNDDRLADLLRLYRSHGLRRERHYWHEVPGHNFRLTNMQAAIGCAQFENLSDILFHRSRVFTDYEQRLSRMSGVKLQRWTSGSVPVVWAIALTLDLEFFPQGRDDVMAAMAAEGIETRPGFQPPSEMTYFEATNTPVSDQLGRCVLSLPTFPSLSEAAISRICDTLAILHQ
jgi:perosamine synthetase